MVQSHSIAGQATHQLTGLFCNTEAQIDETIAHLKRKLAPRDAVALVNSDAIVCNYVDQVEYVVISPVDIGRVRSFIPLVKYRATLIGAIVGKRFRELEPPVTIFFVAPNWLISASVERET